MAGTAIAVEGLQKSYGDVHAVRGIDLTVAEGEVFALLGPNGAGKTTTVEILEGYRTRTKGDVDVLGHDPEKGGTAYRRRIGIVLQETGVQPYLTVAEAVDMYRGYYPDPLPADDVIRLVGLEGKKDARINKLSGGQKRRLDVAIGLAGDPELLFLDEPTTGFDPSARRNAWKMVKDLAALGKTVFLTTHYMDEAQNLADRAAIMVAGRIVAEGSPRTLGGDTGSVTQVRFRLPSKAPALPKKLLGHGIVKRGSYHFETTDPVRLLNDITAWAIKRKVSLVDLSVSRASLEEIYLSLTKEAEAT